MRLIERLAAGRKAFSQPPFWSLEHLQDQLLAFGGSTWKGDEQLVHDFEGYATQAYRDNGIVFACLLARLLLFAEARFQWRRFEKGRPGDLFGTSELAVLERPWPGGTTGELLARMESDVSLAGNFYATVTDDAGRFGRAATGAGRRLVRMRPDWVTILSGSRSESPHALDAKVIGYLYRPPNAPDDEITLRAEDVCHYSPIPDPTAHWRGMSWLTPVLREIEADKAATVHKGRFFRNGATPAMVASLDRQVRPDDFARFVELFNLSHQGAENAYKTLFLGGGADVKPLTMDMRQLDFKQTQGAGETRIAAAAGVPPIIVGLSEGLQSATYSNYGQARRRFADGTMRPLWRTAAASLEQLLARPDGAELWYDDRDIAFLREDQRDLAEIQGQRATQIRTLTDAGYTPESVVEAVQSEDFGLLAHSGLYSVQLHPPGTTPGSTSTTPPATDPRTDPVPGG